MHYTTAAQLPTLDEIRAAVADAVAPLREDIARLRREAARPVSVTEAAELLRVSKRTIQRRIKDGSLPASKVGATTLVDVSAVLPSDERVAELVTRARNGAASARGTQEIAAYEASEG